MIIPHEGHLLMVRRMFDQVQKDFNYSQRENIFHNRCLNNKLCSTVIDGVVM